MYVWEDGLCLDCVLAMSSGGRGTRWMTMLATVMGRLEVVEAVRWEAEAEAEEVGTQPYVQLCLR